MKLIKNLAFGVATIAFTFSVNVQAAWILGLGVEPCSEMLSSIYEDRKSGNDILPMEIIYLNYMHGYISGLNYNLDQMKGEGMDQDMMIEMVIRRCEANPEQLVVQAVDYVWENQL